MPNSMHAETRSGRTIAGSGLFIEQTDTAREREVAATEVQSLALQSWSTHRSQ